MLFSKKGQTMSLNVIIVAALALIVLVVLVAIFTGRIGIFSQGLGQAGDEEIAQMKVNYGDCHPSSLSEAEFKLEMGKAESEEDKVLARAKYQDEISRCKGYSLSKADCQAQDGCSWQ